MQHAGGDSIERLAYSQTKPIPGGMVATSAGTEQETGIAGSSGGRDGIRIFPRRGSLVIAVIVLVAASAALALTVLFPSPPAMDPESRDGFADNMTLMLAIGTALLSLAAVVFARSREDAPFAISDLFVPFAIAMPVAGSWVLAQLPNGLSALRPWVGVVAAVLAALFAFFIAWPRFSQHKLKLDRTQQRSGRAIPARRLVGCALLLLPICVLMLLIASDSSPRAASRNSPNVGEGLGTPALCQGGGMEERDSPVIVEGLAAEAVSLVEMGYGVDAIRLKLAEAWSRYGCPPGAFLAAAESIKELPQPPVESVDEAARMDSFRASLGVLSVEDSLLAQLSARELLEGLARELG
ncbi:hypothetical protein [Plantibacter sp. CFBP 8804]|uniref:hypothetical protein n=1 Tax=Plantibacter sp. CFBP 8804 TaxID=2775270 RepID=UPI00177D0D97|nr:hypothetical protein [Plantibacter sp. CFBP 8804]MBD8519047.1 hypothetical protein [Plantibacter sp. CFBP 8804]